MEMTTSKPNTAAEHTLLAVAKSGSAMSDPAGEVEAATTAMKPTEEEKKQSPALRADIEDLKISRTKSDATVATAASSVTVIDDSIEEAWLLRQKVPGKILKSSTSIFGVNVASFYTYEDVSSYYFKAVQTCAEDIKDIRARAMGNSTEYEHRAYVKKTVLGLADKAQWEIQRLLESRDIASSNENVRRLWEVVTIQAQPRRNISDSLKRKSWWKGKEPLVQWMMVIRGVTFDHHKRTSPVKLGDPWAARENAKISRVEDSILLPAVPTITN